MEPLSGYHYYFPLRRSCYRWALEEDTTALVIHGKEFFQYFDPNFERNNFVLRLDKTNRD